MRSPGNHSTLRCIGLWFSGKIEARAGYSNSMRREVGVMRAICRTKPVAALTFVVALLALAACGKAPQAGGPPAGPPEVAVVAVQPQRVALTVELPGRTSPCLVAEVRPQVGGIIQKRFFVEGSDVKAGDVLYQIDPAMYQAAYASAKAGLARAEANVTSVRARAERYKELRANQRGQPAGLRRRELPPSSRPRLISRRTRQPWRRPASIWRTPASPRRFPGASAGPV